MPPRTIQNHCENWNAEKHAQEFKNECRSKGRCSQLTKGQGTKDVSLVWFSCGCSSALTDQGGSVSQKQWAVTTWTMFVCPNLIEQRIFLFSYKTAAASCGWKNVLEAIGHGFTRIIWSGFNTLVLWEVVPTYKFWVEKAEAQKVITYSFDKRGS